MSKTESTRNTCIVVVEVLLDNESIVIGALADSVEEVIDLEPDQIQPAPRIGTHIRTDFIHGMGKRDTQFIMILDIDRVFSAEELAAVRGAGIQQATDGSSGIEGRWGGRNRPIPTMSAHDEIISTRDYTRLCELIYREAGITLGPEKQTMLEVRIKRRLQGSAICIPTPSTAIICSESRG